MIELEDEGSQEPEQPLEQEVSFEASPMASGGSLREQVSNIASGSKLAESDGSPAGRKEASADRFAQASSSSKNLESLFARVMEANWDDEQQEPCDDQAVGTVQEVGAVTDSTVPTAGPVPEAPQEFMSEADLIALVRAHRPAFLTPAGCGRRGNTKQGKATKD